MANELRVNVQGTGHTVYAVVRSTTDNKVWDDVDSAFETWDDAQIANYAISLADQGGDLYVGDMPTGISVGTEIRTFYYFQDGGSPAITDLLLRFEQGVWNGVSTTSGSIVLSSNALVTLAEIKRHLNITSSDFDDLLTQLINSVSDLFERITGRTLVATDHVQIHQCPQDGVLLDNFPVQHIMAVRQGAGDGMRVQYTGSDIRATVTVTDDKLRIQSLSAAGTTTSNEWTFAAEPTISTLVTAIDAVTDWTATLKNDDAANTLWRVAGHDAKTNEVRLEYADDPCDFRYDMAAGLLRTNVWGPILIEYRAGFETIPWDLRTAAADVVATMFHRAVRGVGLQSESLGDYSYTLADTVATQEGIIATVRRYTAGNTLIGRKI